MGKTGRKIAHLAILLLPLLAACGQISPLGSSRPRRVDASALLNIYSPQNDASGECRYEDVIVPDNDTWLDGTGYYSVCRSSTDTHTVTVFGQSPGHSGQYCVFPAQVSASGSIFPKVDLQGIPIMMCSGETQGGQDFTFEAATYNALFIVPFADRNSMQMCLGLGNYYQCPRSFSYGQF